MIIYYGYRDSSGEYYIVVDSDKCDGCGKCVQHCPPNALELGKVMVDLEDKLVAAVTEEHRRKIKYTCSPCKPETEMAPCMASCEKRALTCTWSPEK